jgi:hypothetical protein
MTTQVLLVGFFLGEGFFAEVLAFAAAFALAEDVVPVTAFFAVPRREAVVVFLVEAGFLAAGAFLAGVALALEVVARDEDLAEVGFFAADVVRLVPEDLGAAAFFVVVALVAAVLVVAVLVVAVLVVVVLAGFRFATTFDFGAGLFSLVDEGSVFTFFGGSFTRPEGPLGNTNSPRFSPVAIALLSWVIWALPISNLY